MRRFFLFILHWILSTPKYNMYLLNCHIITLGLILTGYTTYGKTVLWEDGMDTGTLFHNISDPRLAHLSAFDNEIPFKWTPMKFPDNFFPFDMNNPLGSVTFPPVFQAPQLPKLDFIPVPPAFGKSFPVDQFLPIDMPKGIPPLPSLNTFNFTFPSSIYNVQVPKFMYTPTVNQLTDLGTKFPQLSTDFINNLYSSAATNISKQYTYSRGSKRPLVTDKPTVPSIATTSLPPTSVSTARIPIKPLIPSVSGSPSSTKPFPAKEPVTSPSVTPPSLAPAVPPMKPNITPDTAPATQVMTVTSTTTRSATSSLPASVATVSTPNSAISPPPLIPTLPPVAPSTMPTVPTTNTPTMPATISSSKETTAVTVTGTVVNALPATTTVPATLPPTSLTTVTQSTVELTPVPTLIPVSATTATSTLPASVTAFSTTAAPSHQTTNTPISLSGLFGNSNPENTKGAEQAATVELVSKSVSEMLNLNKSEITDVLTGVTLPQIKDNCSQNAEFPQTSLASPFEQNEVRRSECTKDNRNTPLSSLKYRTVTGRCNNLAFPDRGKESTVFVRLLDPDYADGISEPRRGQSKTALPSARLVSSSLVGTQVRLAPTWTILFMQFGQFLDHDLTHTPQTQIAPGSTCCLPPAGSPSGAARTANVTLAQSQVNLQCLPIDIPANDPFYSRLGQRCMEFTRSLPGSRAGCTLGFRDQLNQVSSFIDGNQIYGSTAEQVNKLRLFQNGFLKSNELFPNNRRYSLLPGDGFNKTCQDATLSRPCFDAGDLRVNVHIGLQALHTMFMRHHNLLCQRLKDVNPRWDDEKLYQEARAIVAAQLQHITYNEWLPVLLGSGIRQSGNNVHTGLSLLTTGRFTGYNITLNPAMSNEFATAAFRVGHSMVTGNFRRLRANLESSGTETVRDTFFQSSRMYTENVADELIIGMMQDAGKIIDNNVVADLSQLLFRSPAASFGMDLVSLNLQRGRDHGLPGYMQYRRLCGLPTANSFQELRATNNATGILPDDVVVRLASVYQSVDDIDLYVAGIAENRINGGIIGPTFACIISEQFSRLRRADRFWYENGLPIPSTFSDAQLAEVRTSSLAKILCDVSTIMAQSQPRVFETVSTANPLQSCQQIKSFDISPWREL